MGTRYVLDVNDDARNARDALHLGRPGELRTLRWLSDEAGKSYFTWTQQSSDFIPPHPGKAPLPPKGGHLALTTTRQHSSPGGRAAHPSQASVGGAHRLAARAA